MGLGGKSPFRISVILASMVVVQPLLAQLANPVSTSAADSIGYFPLSIGNAWTYACVWDTTVTGTATVFDTTRIANRLYYLYSGGPLDLIGVMPLAADTIRLDSVGRVWKYERGQDWMLFQLFGGSFVSHTTYPENPPTVVPVLTGLKDTVPAGTFTECVNLYFRRSFSDESVGYVFAPEVGIIKWYSPFYCKTVLLRAVIDGKLISAVKHHRSEMPEKYDLEQNYPNPFNPSTTIRYGLPQRSHLLLTVFSTLGQEVATLFQGEQEAGYHDVQFDGTGLSSGVYFYRMTAGDYVATKKLLLLR